MSVSNSDEKIDYYQLLVSLTTNDQENKNLSESLQVIIQNVESCLPKWLQDEIKKSLQTENINNTRYIYLQVITTSLIELQKSMNESEFLSISQFRIIKIVTEFIISIGVVPCLLPGVGIDMCKLCPRAVSFSYDNLGDLEKYKIIALSTKTLIDLYNEELSLRPTIISQIGPLIAALLQLSHAPLMKPNEHQYEMQKHKKETGFRMSTDLYNELCDEQIKFREKLLKLFENCPQTVIFRELMVIFGLKNSPKWLRKKTQEYIVKKLMEPHGLYSLIEVTCEDTLDSGIHWNKLDTVVKLIAAPLGDDPNAYYDSITQQIINMMDMKNIRHIDTIVNNCIAALLESNPDICKSKIINPILSPFHFEKDNIRKNTVISNELEVEKCITGLIKWFTTNEAKFKKLPIKFLFGIAIPLFCVHNKICESASLLKKRVKSLLLKILSEDFAREKLFAACLGHDTVFGFGEFIKVEFGATGGVEIKGIEENPDFEEFSVNLYNLIMDDEEQLFHLFTYLLNYTANLNQIKNKENKLLETTDDELDRITKYIVTVKLLSSLSNNKKIQESTIKSPEPLFTFIKSLFHKYLQDLKNNEDSDTEILYISLMLIKIILSERKPSNAEPFKEFGSYLKNMNSEKLPKQISSLTKNIIKLVETLGQSKQKLYDDLSVDSKGSKKFEDALKDLADPLLPVRGHGLITLTKLIENNDPYTIASKAVILRFFQENLKHDDSFIYLAAINGLCALATSYPQVVVETLVQEYIDMPLRATDGEITPETRMKLGEILVKTTRALGEMGAAYKNILINGFLCATRDSDPLIRASSLSCLGELCKILGFRLGNVFVEIVYCVTCILKTDKTPECRRAAVLLITLLLRGLGKHALTELANDLVELFRALKHLRDHDSDPVLRLHAQLALEELDDIVRDFLFTPSKLEKQIFVLKN